MRGRARGAAADGPGLVLGLGIGYDRAGGRPDREGAARQKAIAATKISRIRGYVANTKPTTRVLIRAPGRSRTGAMGARRWASSFPSADRGGRAAGFFGYSRRRWPRVASRLFSARARASSSAPRRRRPRALASKSSSRSRRPRRRARCRSVLQPRPQTSARVPRSPRRTGLLDSPTQHRRRPRAAISQSGASSTILSGVEADGVRIGGGRAGDRRRSIGHRSGGLGARAKVSESIATAAQCTSARAPPARARR